MLDVKTATDLQKIYVKRGVISQLLKLNEEIKELEVEQPFSDEWFEELCDVWVILSQHVIVNQDICLPVIKNKIQRTLDRIESGYFEKEDLELQIKK